MKTTEIQLNYLELNFLLSIKTSKDLFLKILGKEKIALKDELPASELAKHFDNVKSNDARYDGQNKVLFYLEHFAENYKKHVNSKSFLKRGKFVGKTKLFYKICSEEQLKHAVATFEAKTTKAYRENIK